MVSDVCEILFFARCFLNLDNVGFLYNVAQERNTAVDGHPSFGDKLVRAPARGKSFDSEVAVDANGKLDWFHIFFYHVIEEL